MAREIKNSKSGVISTTKYSPALRSFALTLHYYSPRAYEYVRKTFTTSLPHSRTVKMWYSKVGGEPGFTKESLAALKNKAEISNHPLLATLVIDEMSIRRRVEWDGQKFRGYVDMGTEIEGDHLAEAKEALVFLVTAINNNFKVPVGYFLVDGVTGQQRADLVQLCLKLIHSTGVRIVALTFDGCAANISMAKHLGCSFEQQNVNFEHPVTKEFIVAILDPCHMIKLIRNTFEMHKTLVDKDGNKIQWQHLVELNKLQYQETFHLSNKLRDRHINFQNERMKVKLATQLFSSSVAGAIKFCRQSGISSFYDSEPTEFFLLIFNNIFDIFNSRNLHHHGFKKALNVNNAYQVFQFLDEASNYIKEIKTETGIFLTNSRRKTGFLGFLGCIKALKHLYVSLIESETLLYLPFYKFCQDHIELFFCNIRAQGGTNNNPTVRQFISAYKKLLIHVKLKDINTGNCIALEQISILNCSSAVERINRSFSLDIPLSNEQREEDSDIEELRDQFSDFSNQAIGHIAGYIVRVLTKKIKCDICVSALVTHHFHPFHKFIIARDQGGLLYPSPDVVKICQTTETFMKNINTIGFRKEIAISKILRNFIGTSLFNDIISHQLGEFPSSNHITDLMKAIIEKYINVRLHHLLKLKLKPSKRQFLNKYILFQGQ